MHNATGEWMRTCSRVSAKPVLERVNHAHLGPSELSADPPPAPDEFYLIADRLWRAGHHHLPYTIGTITQVGQTCDADLMWPTCLAN